MTERSPPKLADKFRVNASYAQRNALNDFKRYEYLVSRRDQLLDRVRFGALALNAASLVATLSLISSLPTGVVTGLPNWHPVWSARAFVAGLAVAAVSIWWQSQRSVHEASDANTRYSAAGGWADQFDAPATEENADALKNAMDRYHRAPLVDFQYSWVAIALQHSAFGFWVFGVVWPALS